MAAIDLDLQGEWELSFDTTLDGNVIPLPNPYHRLKFGPAKRLPVGAPVGKAGVYTIKEYTGEYGPPDPPSPADPSGFVAQVFFAVKRGTVISIIQKHEITIETVDPTDAGNFSYYVVYSARPLDSDTIQGSYTDNAGNQGDFKLVRSS